MSATRMRTVAGVEVPETSIIERAINYAQEACDPYVFNHAMRSWLFAAGLAKAQDLAHDAEVLAVGTVLHDITLSERFAGPRRFEVEGADLARRFVRDAGFDDRRAQLVWDMVALNSTPSISLYKEAEVAIGTQGIALDIIGLGVDRLAPAAVAAIVGVFPRLEMKRRMASCFCHIAATKPETTYDNFLRDYGERFVPGYKPVSVVDMVAQAPFAE